MAEAASATSTVVEGKDVEIPMGNEAERREPARRKRGNRSIRQYADDLSGVNRAKHRLKVGLL